MAVHRFYRLGSYLAKNGLTQPRSERTPSGMLRDVQQLSWKSASFQAVSLAQSWVRQKGLLRRKPLFLLLT
jgi:hypothetical protein